MRTLQIATAVAGALAGTALTLTAAAPAQAVTESAASGWTMSLGGPIRTCASVNCSTIVGTDYGDDIY
jgi:hypothetical protein